MSYDFLKKSTQLKLSKNEVWSKQINDPNIIDVSLNAGPLIIKSRTDDDQQFLKFTNAVESIISGFEVKFPFFQYEKTRNLHSTLLTIFNGTPEQFQVAKPEVSVWCQQIARLTQSISTLQIVFDEIVLTSNGTLILTGYSDQIVNLRNAVYENLPIPADLHKNIIHITLGRLVKNMDNGIMMGLAEYLADNSIVELPCLHVLSPHFVVSRGAFSSLMDKELTSEFSKFWS